MVLLGVRQLLVTLEHGLELDLKILLGHDYLLQRLLVDLTVVVDQLNLAQVESLLFEADEERLKLLLVKLFQATLFLKLQILRILITKLLQQLAVILNLNNFLFKFLNLFLQKVDQLLVIVEDDVVAFFEHASLA